MCGIFGVYSTNKATCASSAITSGLLELEYRGYDSCGLCTTNNSGELKTIKCIGAVKELKAHPSYPIEGNVGIGHVRWATHGKITENNAHPHSLNNISVVHNGMLENIEEIESFLNQNKAPHQYSPSTSDTTLIPALISFLTQQNGGNFKQAFLGAKNMLKGNSAIVAITTSKNPKEASQTKSTTPIIACTASGCPLYIGKSEEGFAIASDPFAIKTYPQIHEANEDEVIFITENNATIITNSAKGQTEEPLNFKPNKIFQKGSPATNTNQSQPKPSQFQHTTRKEIQEQEEISSNIIAKHTPQTLQTNAHAKTPKKQTGLASQASKVNSQLEAPLEALALIQNIPLPHNISEINKITFIASGSSFNASFIIAKYIEEEMGIETSCEFGSEFAYKPNATPLQPNTLAFFISQSGETLDSIVSIKKANQLQMQTMGIISSPYSTMGKMLQTTIICEGTKEIGVAATKSFSSQLLYGLMFAINMGLKTNKLSQKRAQEIITDIQSVPKAISKAIAKEEEIALIAKQLAHAKAIQFIGRGISYGLAMEGSLKTKELSYIPSEPLFAGELKHGHLAVVDSTTWCVCPMLQNGLSEKTTNNLHEIITRQGNAIIISNQAKSPIGEQTEGQTIKHLSIPTSGTISSILAITVAQQLLAYHTANHLGKEIDRPRNLAKSITVE